MSAMSSEVPHHEAPEDERQRFRRVSRLIASIIGAIDAKVTEQVNQILHAQEFQRLEAGWRGLYYLWRTAREVRQQAVIHGGRAEVDIRLLTVRKRELQKDFESSSEFDRNWLFQKVYEDEFGTPGGTPYGLLIVDFEFSQSPADLDLLEQMGAVAAAAFAPLIAGAAPELLGLEDFRQLERPVELQPDVQGRRYGQWRRLRSKPDARFIGLTLPRILLRSPYEDDGSHRFGFRFAEGRTSDSERGLLWGSAAWGFAAVVCRAFGTTGWFADIRGMQRGKEVGGLVTGLPSAGFRMDPPGTAERGCVEVHIPDRREGELAALGFIPLCHCRETSAAVFYSAASVHDAKEMASSLATANSRLSAMLQYVLCCSRFAHYLKIGVRAMTGAGLSAEEVQNRLNAWIQEYVAPVDHATPDIKSRYPLREAQVSVEEQMDRPGSYLMRILLQPHYQLDQLASSITFVATRIRIVS